MDWEDPPPHPDEGKLADARRELQENPGRWAKLSDANPDDLDEERWYSPLLYDARYEVRVVMFVGVYVRAKELFT